MSRPKVKFCGIAREEDIRSAERLGVDYLGLILVDSSPRRVLPSRAGELSRCVRRARLVGVFDDDSRAMAGEQARRLKLDFVQLHSEPDLEFVRSIGVPVIQAFRGVVDEAILAGFLEYCPYVLIDKERADKAVDIDAVARLPEAVRCRLFLAGGLSAGSVGRAVDEVRPYAVDCARGVESAPGIKDPARMAEFMKAVRP